MDLGKIESLIRDLERPSAGWLADAERDVALRALKSETGQDFGADPDAWRRWLTTVARTVPDIATVPLSEATTQAAAALSEMGVLDLDELREWVEASVRKEPFDPIAPGLAEFLGNRAVGGVWISSEGGPNRAAPSEVPACRPQAGMRWYSRDEAYAPRDASEVAAVEAQLRRALSADVSLSPLEGGFSILLGDLRANVVRDHFATTFELLHEWAMRARPDRRVTLDQYGRIRLLSESQVEAVRRWNVLRLAKLHPTSPGTPHAEVERVFEGLGALGFDLTVCTADRAWGVLEDTEAGYGNQLVRLAGAGLEVETDDCFRSLDALYRKLSFILGATITPRRSADALFAEGDSSPLTAMEGLLHDVGVALAEARAPLHLVALREGENRYRLLPVPWDLVAALGGLLVLAAGATVPGSPGRPRWVGRFTGRT